MMKAWKETQTGIFRRLFFLLCYCITMNCKQQNQKETSLLILHLTASNVIPSLCHHQPGNTILLTEHLLYRKMNQGQLINHPEQYDPQNWITEDVAFLLLLCVILYLLCNTEFLIFFILIALKKLNAIQLWVPVTI